MPPRVGVEAVPELSGSGDNSPERRCTPRVKSAKHIPSGVSSATVLLDSSESACSLSSICSKDRLGAAPHDVGGVESIDGGDGSSGLIGAFGDVAESGKVK